MDWAEVETREENDVSLPWVSSTRVTGKSSLFYSLNDCLLWRIYGKGEPGKGSPWRGV